MFHSLTELVTNSGWAYAIIFAIAALDAIFPVVPSETMVITGGVYAAAGQLELPVVMVAGAAGAFTGDTSSYLLGKKVGQPIVDRFFQGQRAKTSLDWAKRMLDERGGMLIVVARFIPGGRTAATLTAGLVNFRWTRFVAFAALGAIGWSCYAALVGYLGGKTFEQQTWKALLLAFAIAGAVTVSVELVRRLRTQD